jgi:hypothetical protein
MPFANSTQSRSLVPGLARASRPRARVAAPIKSLAVIIKRAAGARCMCHAAPRRAWPFHPKSRGRGYDRVSRRGRVVSSGEVAASSAPVLLRIRPSPATIWPGLSSGHACPLCICQVAPGRDLAGGPRVALPARSRLGATSRGRCHMDIWIADGGGAPPCAWRYRAAEADREPDEQLKLLAWLRRREPLLDAPECGPKSERSQAPRRSKRRGRRRYR